MANKLDDVAFKEAVAIEGVESDKANAFFGAESGVVEETDEVGGGAFEVLALLVVTGGERLRGVSGGRWLGCAGKFTVPVLIAQHQEA